MRMAFLRLIVAVLSLLAAGCAENQSRWDRVGVSGKVTFEGRPVADGSISLRPSAGTQGPASGAKIEDGKYAIPVEQGPATGRYTAMLTIVVPDSPDARQRQQRPTPPGMKQFPETHRFEREVDFEADRHTHDFSL
jgi:hypothetical protein